MASSHHGKCWKLDIPYRKAAFVGNTPRSGQINQSPTPAYQSCLEGEWHLPHCFGGWTQQLSGCHHCAQCPRQIHTNLQRSWYVLHYRLLRLKASSTFGLQIFAWQHGFSLDLLSPLLCSDCTDLLIPKDSQTVGFVFLHKSSCICTCWVAAGWLAGWLAGRLPSTAVKISHFVRYQELRLWPLLYMRGFQAWSPGWTHSSKTSHRIARAVDNFAMAFSHRGKCWKIGHSTLQWALVLHFDWLWRAEAFYQFAVEIQLMLFGRPSQRHNASCFHYIHFPMLSLLAS